MRSATSPSFFGFLVRRFTLAAIVPLALVGLAAAAERAWVRYREAEAAILRQALLVRQATEARVELLRRAIVGLADELASGAAPLASAAAAALARAHAGAPEFLSLLVADAEGRVAAASTRPGVGDARSLVGVSVADRSSFALPMATGAPFVSDAFRGRGLRGDPIVALSAPISIAGRPSGVVEGSVELARLWAVDPAVEFPAGTEVVLLDRELRVIHAASACARPVVEPLAGAEALPDAPGSEVFRYRPDAPGSRLQIAAWLALDDSGWSVLVQRPLVEIVEAALPTLERRVEERTRDLAAHERDLRDAHRFLETLHEATPAMIYTYDERGILKSANRATAEHLGAPVERLLGSSALDFMTHASAAGFRERIERLRREGEIEEEVEAVRADGERRYVRFRNRRLDLDGGELFLGTATDVTERRRLEELLREQALRDPLTGLANRRLLDDHFAQALAWAARRRQRGERDRVAVLALDLDGFKTVNDALGHAAGDRLLVAGARAVEPLVRRTDTFAPLGGDEFVLLVVEAGSDAELESLAGRLLGAIAASGREVAPEQAVSASVGIARAPEDGAGAEALLAAADRALYAAKSAGRRCFRFPAPVAPRA